MNRIIIVGCGLTGAVAAKYYADKGYKVDIYDRRDHIAGNMYDYIDSNGIMVHKYGPHVFHTNSEHLASFMMKYSEWVPFHVTSQVEMCGKSTPSPFNFQTIDDYYSIEEAAQIKKALLTKYPNQSTVTIVELLENDDPYIKKYAKFLFERDYSLYTAKQWGIKPEEIDVSVLKRVPVRLSYEDGYFNDLWQMVPKKGYTAWFQQLLNDSNIDIHLSTEALNHISFSEDKVLWDNKEYMIFYTGALDELFSCRFGKLPYRSLRFVWKTENVHLSKKAALTALPEDAEVTRITEYNQFPQAENQNVTSLAYEYPISYTTDKDIEPYYPILTGDSMELHKQYLELAKQYANLTVAGRLANFKYYNMDQALNAVLNVLKNKDM